MKKSGIQNVALMALSIFVLAGCDNSKVVKRGNAPVEVREMVVGESTSSANEDYNYSGVVEEETGTALSFSVNGTVKQINVKVGDRVRKGQLIASVDPASVKNSYDIAHSNMVQAQDAYQRYKQLYDKGSLPEIRWVEVQSKLQEATSAENIARKNLNDCNLYAPYAGVISEKTAEVGQNVAPGMPVAKLITTNVLNVKISVPESEVANLTIGQSAYMRVQAIGGTSFIGHIVEKNVIADPISRSYAVKIRINDARKDLLPGMITEVRLSAKKSDVKQSAQPIVIPANLLQLDDDSSNFVWIDEGGKAVRRTVVCGEYQSNGVQILSGLKIGDKLIVEGQQKVCFGTAVKVK